MIKYRRIQAHDLQSAPTTTTCQLNLRTTTSILQRNTSYFTRTLKHRNLTFQSRKKIDLLVRKW